MHQTKTVVPHSLLWAQLTLVLHRGVARVDVDGHAAPRPRVAGARHGAQAVDKVHGPTRRWQVEGFPPQLLSVVTPII